MCCTGSLGDSSTAAGSYGWCLVAALCQVWHALAAGTPAPGLSTGSDATTPTGYTLDITVDLADFMVNGVVSIEHQQLPGVSALSCMLVPEWTSSHWGRSQATRKRVLQLSKDRRQYSMPS
jgi:hypothetical protein